MTVDSRSFILAGLEKGAWAETTVRLDRLKPSQPDSVSEISFFVPRAAQLLIDDVLVYEAGKK